ncbi:MAG: toprim domain-containing protein [Candidatus Micrarchaeota archaeon]|nr:toprim domain-containing protein [Candidatus Micrarchaeota archaeon]
MGEREIAELLDALQDIRKRTVIVEGKRDKKALCSLGFSRVYDISGKDIGTFSERFGSERVVVLTDFDREGEKIAKRLSLFLRVDHKTRNKIRKLSIKAGFVTIESFKKLKGDVHEQTCAVEFKIHDNREIRGKRGCGKTRRDRGDIRSDRGASRA